MTLSRKSKRIVWWLCWPYREYWLWRAQRAHTRFLRWLNSNQPGDTDEPY